MAIKKVTILPTGYEAEYIRVRHVEVVYEIYKDEATRRAGKQPLEVNKVVWYNGEYDEEGNKLHQEIVAIGYSLLKEASIFEDAEDII